MVKFIFGTELYLLISKILQLILPLPLFHLSAAVSESLSSP